MRLRPGRSFSSRTWTPSSTRESSACSAHCARPSPDARSRTTLQRQFRFCLERCQCNAATSHHLALRCDALRCFAFAHVQQLRIRKSEAEIEVMKKSCAISAAAFVQVCAQRIRVARVAGTRGALGCCSACAPRRSLCPSRSSRRSSRTSVRCEAAHSWRTLASVPYLPCASS